MSKFKEHIDISNFSIQNIDTTSIEDILDWLPTNGTFDLNIAEQGVVKSLQAEDFCQDILAKLDRYLGELDNKRSKVWALAALEKSIKAGHKTAKDKEWFAAADDDYINITNEITLAKAAKKWFENKASYFRNWHYSFKTFLKRDYSLERLGNYSELGYNIEDQESPPQKKDQSFGGDLDW